MAVLALAAIKTLMLNALAANVTTDAPLSTAEQEDFINDAYADIYEIAGGGVKIVASATAWTSAQLSTTGVVTGILTDIAEVLRVWASTTSGSVGVSSGDNELDRAERSHIQWLRKSSVTGTYDRPKLYSITRLSTTTPASVNLMQLDYWPTVTGFYLPTEYRPQFTPLDSSTVTTPDVNDIESRDIAIWAAVKAAPTIGRAEMVPGLMARMSEHTAKALERKMDAILTADQDK